MVRVNLALRLGWVLTRCLLGTHIRQFRPNIRGQSSRNAGSRNIGDGAGVLATPESTVTVTAAVSVTVAVATASGVTATVTVTVDAPVVVAGVAAPSTLAQ